MEVVNRYLSELAPAVLADHPDLVLQRGNVLRRLGQAGGAVACYEEARRTFMRYGDHAGVCRVLSRLAEVNYAQGHYGRSEALAREALALATADDHAGRCHALIALAKSVGLLQGMDAGRTLAEQAVAEADQAGDQVTPTARANLLQSLGQICWWHGDPQATVAHCRAAIQPSIQPGLGGAGAAFPHHGQGLFDYGDALSLLARIGHSPALCRAGA